ncbi:hypothetical protein PGA11657_15320 [Lactobacillus paragasseri]|nr:hypothetical protein PGA11657_15320 [Lactobacillus paragasseri]
MIFILGKNFKPLASETKVKEPVIKACEAMIAARVARIIAKNFHWLGRASKNGLKSVAPA